MEKNRSFLVSLIYFACLTSAESFSIPQKGHMAQVVPSAPGDDISMNAVAADNSWSEEAVDSKFVDGIREELISKYLDQGISRENAEKEVDSFLIDKERSRKYMEMRAYASKAKGYDLGIGEGFQFIFAFLVGIAGVTLHQSIRSEDGGLPFL